MARPIVGGIEISDSALRVSYFDGGAWHMGGVRLEPGILENGKIADRSRLLAALQSLKLQVFGPKYEKKRVNVIASLSSVSIYSQVFSLPMIRGENLEKAVALNMQMVSPVDLAHSYSGWQVVGKDERSSQIEILGAFIDKSLVDELSKVFLETGFLLVALESRAVSLARLVREEGAGVDITKPYIIINLDDSGLDFLVIRHGEPYFEYFNPWREVVDEKGQISLELFRATVTRSLYQVLNFYSQHWSETVSEVIISASVLREEMEKIVKEGFPLVARVLKLKSSAVAPEWFVSLGCGIRGFRPRGRDKEISILGIGADEEFRREQLLDFSGSWRLLMPVILGVMFLSLLLGDLFLVQKKRLLESQPLFGLNDVQTAEYESLRADAQAFNRAVSLIGAVQRDTLLKSDIIAKIDAVVKENGVSISRLNFQAADAPISLSGLAESEDKLSAFKGAMAGNQSFKEVNLPLSGVKSEAKGVSFSMTFRINSPQD